MLYKFSNLSQRISQLGYPEVTESGFKSIRVDFNAEKLKQAVREGKVRFGSDGIYLTHEGREWKGYMYMPTYRISRYGSMPRFHLTRCGKIEDLFVGGYGHYYKWSNNELNDITDRDTREVYKNQKLQLCSHCQSSIIGIRDTEDFFKTLETQGEKEINVEVDIFGYTLDWQNISRAYRREKKYTCENCGIKMEEPQDRRFIHVHHKDGNKVHNNPNNLECLCILCHANKDAIHEHNFERKRMQKVINTFVKKYRGRLSDLGNKYLN